VGCGAGLSLPSAAPWSGSWRGQTAFPPGWRSELGLQRPGSHRQRDLCGGGAWLLCLRIFPAGIAGAGPAPASPLPGLDPPGKDGTSPWGRARRPTRQSCSRTGHTPSCLEGFDGFSCRKMGTTCERQHRSGLGLIRVSKRVEGRKEKCA